jgi:hypothetical protein
MVSHLRSLTGHRLETSALVYEQKGILIRFVHQPRAVYMTELKSVCQLCGAKKACPEELTETESVTCLLPN